jgi:hypothetical protein
MSDTVRPFLLVVVALAAALPAGCRPSPRLADPGKARETLRLALDTWHKGEKPESLRGSVVVAEPKWQEGCRLLKYELADRDQMSGYDAVFTATLWLQDAAGKSSQEKAFYNVSTYPSLVVVRSEAP